MEERRELQKRRDEQEVSERIRRDKLETEREEKMQSFMLQMMQLMADSKQPANKKK